ncbi:MipA/OmpV family protein [Shewanella cyperi]|uniref:MipA/OmpV family protein n=1 Tax=Shewanella cyperi TaxID=2814292 RepID=A0A975AL06_9GAMM|nr:MipA/OmpV family protein [Shewanella cyperi]QSX30705.1 MipA/OmpV family protein [Shewanella cyperi]
MIKLLSFCTALLLLPAAWAAPGCDAQHGCIESNSWELGLALGYGERSNPLREHNDIPLYLVPEIAYYGDDWYFDNGSLGYILWEDDRFSLNLAGNFASDRAYFDRWDPANLFITGNLSNRDVPIDQGPVIDPSGEDELTSFDELETRNFTYLGGLEAYYFSELGMIKLAWMHDLLGVHQGSEVQFKWEYGINFGDLSTTASVFADWKSKDLVAYYYGVRPTENLYWSQTYQATSGWNRGLELNLSYPLAKHWELLGMVRYTRLAESISASPLVVEDNSLAYFLGIGYSF